MRDADGALAGDLQDLGGVGEPEVVDGDGLQGAHLDAAVRLVAGAIQHGHAVPRQGGAAGQQGGLVGLDDKQVVGLLAGHQELGGTGMGVECVGGDHHAVKVEVGQQRPKAGDLFGRAADLLLGQHRAAGVVHRRQQVHRAAVAGGGAGATQGLAVDRHRPLPWPPPLGIASAVAAVMVLAVGEPGADRGGQGVGVQPAERAADGGLGRHRPVVGGVAPGAKRGTDRLGRVGGPLGNGGKRAGAGQHRGGRQGQDGDQRMAAAQGTPRVGDGGQVAEQVRGLGFLEGAGIAQQGQARRDRA